MMDGLQRGWQNRAKLTTDEACELADGYLLSVELLSGAPAEGERLRLARAEWFVLWALLRARDEAVEAEGA